MTETASTVDLEQPLDSNQLDEFRKAANAARAWDIEHRPASNGAFVARVAALRREFRLLEVQLAKVPNRPSENQTASQSALFELKENFRVARTSTIAVSSIPKSITKLPRVIVPGQKDEPRVAAL